MPLLKGSLEGIIKIIAKRGQVTFEGTVMMKFKFVF